MNNGKCFWLPFKNSSAIRKVVTSLQAPTSDWQIYPARILYTTEARSRLEKAADTSNIETDTEEKRETKQKRKMTMTFCESDEDIVVSDEEQHGRYYLKNSNGQSISNVILNIAEVLKSLTTPHIKSEVASFSVAVNNIDFAKETNVFEEKSKLFSNILVDKLLIQQSTSTASASISSTESIFERCLTKSDVNLLEEKVKASNVFKGRVMRLHDSIMMQKLANVIQPFQNF
ncbi:uncharacterized protein LOC124817058 isoform X3 [Hydra vulgaris]|uniref:uncharacterized protein LOC124817058 isoform X3 n=1 Tax=Hydra vulgaris TaxID=6087 RepID=UPI0032EA86D0